MADDKRIYDYEEQLSHERGDNNGTCDTYSSLGDAYHLNNGTVIICADPPETLPDHLVQGSLRANTVYLGTNEYTGNACVVFCNGEMSMIAELTRDEAFLYSGMLLGVANRKGPQ
jgi:hypothetical protein